MSTWAVQSEKRGLYRLEYIFCLSGLVVSATLLLASRLSYNWLPLDALSQMTLHIALCGGACLVGLIIPWARLLTVPLLIFIGVLIIGGYSHYVSAHPRHLNSLSNGEMPLQVVTFNTSIINENNTPVAKELKRLDADVVILMEFSDRKWSKMKGSVSFFPYNAGCVPRRHCHFVVLSKIPIAGSEVREGWDGPLMVSITLGGAFAGLHVIGVHFPRLPHVSSQFKQLRVLLAYLERLKGSMVVAGDFNATPFSKLVSNFAAETGMKRLTGLPTWPSYIQLPQFGIDHVFVSKEIRLLESVRIGRASGSDHYPVLAKLAIPTTN